MKRVLYGLLAALLLVLVPGCGNDKEKGMNRHKDLPRASPTESAK